MTARARALAAFEAGVGGRLPFPEPGSFVVRVDAAFGKEAFRNPRSGLPWRPEQAHEFSRDIFVFGPMDPSSGIELRSQAEKPLRTRSLSDRLSRLIARTAPGEQAACWFG